MMLYQRIPTKRFRKDVQRLHKSGFDLEKLEHVIDLLVSGKILPQQYRDHELRGQLRGSRECHISGDWLLRYSKDENLLILLLISTGDHRRVLGIE